MDEQAMQSKAKEPKTPPKIEAALFVPDPALDSLYRQAVVVASNQVRVRLRNYNPPPQRSRRKRARIATVMHSN